MIYLLNKILFQWFFFRLCIIAGTKGEYIGIMFPIIPLTEWKDQLTPVYKVVIKLYYLKHSTKG